MENDSEKSIPLNLTERKADDIHEIITPTQLLLKDVPKMYDRYFCPEYLTFIALPKVFTMAEFYELFKGKTNAENIKSNIESGTAFIPGVKRESAIVMVYDPKSNASASCVVSIDSDSKEQPVYSWQKRKLNFSQPETRDRFLPLFKVLQELKLPRDLRNAILAQQDYWPTVFTYTVKPTPENIEKLRLLFSSPDFGYNRWYGGNRLMVVKKSTRQRKDLLIEITGSTKKELPQILRTIDVFLSSPLELSEITENIRKYYNSVTVDDVKKWMSKFRSGIEYVYKKYDGVVANNIKIAESIVWNGRKRDDIVTYIPDANTDAIVVTHKFLGRSIKAMKEGSLFSSSHLSPSFDIRVSSEDFPVLLGVEEAHHSYFLKSGLGIVDPVPEKYFTDPVEIAAGVAVNQAIKDLNIQTFLNTDATFV